MKKTILISLIVLLLLSFLAIAETTTLVEDFEYSDGLLPSVSGGKWEPNNLPKLNVSVNGGRALIEENTFTNLKQGKQVNWSYQFMFRSANFGNDWVGFCANADRNDLYYSNANSDSGMCLSISTTDTNYHFYADGIQVNTSAGTCHFDPAVWYWGKLQFNISGKGVFSWRVWEVNTTEPEYYNFTNHWLGSETLNHYGEYFNMGGPGGSTFYVDNLYNLSNVSGGGGASGDDSINISTPEPLDQTQFNTNLLSINWTVNASYPFNCTLFYDGAVNDSRNNTPAGIDVEMEFNLSFSSTTNTNFTYWISCVANQSNEENSTASMVYIDQTFPTITTDFYGWVFANNNVSAQLNFSDSFSLYSYNISIDGTILSSKGEILKQTYIFNLTYNATEHGLGVGSHNVSVRVADGHTASAIPDYDVKDGLFNDYIRFDTSYNSIKIKLKDSSFFDEWTATKLTDRYNFEVEPNEKGLSSYTFEVEANEQIHIINTETRYKNYLITGNNWVDFVIPDQPQSKVAIKKINDKKVEVTVSNLDNPQTILFNSIGELNIVESNFTFYTINILYEYENATLEQRSTTFYLYINTTDGVNYTNASFSYNNTKYNLTKISLSGYDKFSTTLTTPQLSSGVTQANITWNWTYQVYGFNNTEIGDIIGNQSVNAVLIDNCSEYGTHLINFSLYDEETKSSEDLLNSSIETYITLENEDSAWYFNESTFGDGFVSLGICMSNDSFSSATYKLGVITRYKALDHAVEFYYLQNYTLTNSTFLDVSLYTLNTDTDLAEYSTSFLVNYLDENYLPVGGAIVDLLRLYVSEGKYISVEHAQTDDSGSTRLHFVTEDVKYKAIVRKDNQVLFISNPFLAICQASPCQINFQEENELNDVWNYDNVGNINYNIKLNEATRTTSVDFTTTDGSSIIANFKVIRFDAYLNNTICDENLTTSAGTISCTIPLTERNATYVAEFSSYSSQKSFIGHRFIDLTPDPLDTFGSTGIIMAFLLFLCLSLMAMQSGEIPTIVFGVIGLVIASLLTIFSGGSILGIGSFILWLVCAGGIIIWKLTK